MKRILKIMPVLMIIAAAALCLSFDQNGKLSLQGNNDQQAELFQTAPAGPYKVVIDRCPNGGVSQECQTGGGLQCVRITCRMD